MTNSLLIVLALTAAFANCVYAGNPGSSTSTIESDVQRELVRRQQDLVEAHKLVAEGDLAMKDKDYEVAYIKYLQALDKIGSGEINKNLRAQVLAKFSSAGVSHAEKLIADGKYNEAEKVAKTILLPQYNPTYKPAIQLLANLEQPSYYNKTVTPQFAGDRDEVMRLLGEAEGLYSRGSNDLAMKRYEQVLNIDPYNIAARKGQEQINNAKSLFDKSAYNETRARLLWQVEQSWSSPIRKFNTPGSAVYNRDNYDSGTAKITAKLNRIIIPKIELRDVTIREAVDFLKAQSRVLDTTEDSAEKKGVNIVLKFPVSATGGAPVAGTEPTAAPTVTGAPAAAGAGADASALAIPGEIPSESTRISLSMNNIPLYEAIKYLARYADMKVKVEPYIVAIVPQTEPTEAFIQRIFKVPAGFIPAKGPADPAAGGPVFPGNPPPATGDTTAGKITGVANAKTYLESQDIPFPQGATATYNASSSTMTVRNTPSNMDIVELLVSEAWSGAPKQVEIESKFLEVNQNNLKELGIDWLLGPFSINGSSGVYGAGGTLGETTTVSAADYPILNSNGQPVGTDPVTGGLRTGAQAITPTTIEGIIAQQANLATGGAIGPGPGIFSIAGVFTNPQFQAVIRALNQKKGVDLMSAPMVTTKSGQRATINIIREFRYPTQFDPPQIPQSVGGGGSSTTTGTSLFPFISTGTITPSTPSQFEVKNTGVSLEVEPIVASDGFTIDLSLSPQVVDFEGFINYGTPILGITTSFVGILPVPRTVVLSPNTINQPIFSTRKVVTSVSIFDGQTVALGGLIREDVQKVQDKVPFLGDIPFLGRAFRSDVEQKTKKNLLIFVTAHLVDAQGNYLRVNEEEEENVIPLGVPEDLPRPHLPPLVRGK